MLVSNIDTSRRTSLFSVLWNITILVLSNPFLILYMQLKCIDIYFMGILSTP